MAFLGPWRSSISPQDGPDFKIEFCEGASSATGFHAGFCSCSGPVIFLSHQCCWKAINQPKLLSSSRLLRLAQHTQPVGPPKQLDSYGRTLGRQTNVPICDADTSLGRLITCIARKLPFELQSMILDHATGSLFASLLKATSVSTQLLSRLDTSKPSSPRIAAIGTVNNVRSLHAQFSDVFGMAYLTQIESNQAEHEPSPFSISVKDSALRGIRFALGEFGLRAFCIVYQDGSHSDWLGDPSGCWYGITEGQDMKNLCMLVDVSCVSAWNGESFFQALSQVD